LKVKIGLCRKKENGSAIRDCGRRISEKRRVNLWG